MSDVILLSGFALVVVLGVGLMALLFRRQFQASSGQSALDNTLQEQRAAALEQAVGDVAKAQDVLTGRLQVLAETQTNSQTQLMKAFGERLDQITAKMGVSLTESATKTAESLGQINNRLTVIDEAQKNLTELSGQVVGLQDILANKQARGAFGEVQMGDIVRNALPPSAYALQVQLSNGKRADCLIHLPNPPGSIAVDSKFPLESFHLLRKASDEQTRKTAMRAFRQDVRKHIDDIAKRYIVPGETAESALMFLPSEAIYAELHSEFPDIMEHSYKARVWIVSPTTLMATLNTVRAVLKDVKMREQAHLIQSEVGKMMQDVGRLIERVGNLESHFQRTEKDLAEIRTSATKITRRGKLIEGMQLEGSAEEIAPLLTPDEPDDASMISTRPH